MGRRGREEKEEEEGAKEILALLCRVLQSISRAGGFALKEMGHNGQIQSTEWHDGIYTVEGALWLPGLKQTVNRETS